MHSLLLSFLAGFFLVSFFFLFWVGWEEGVCYYLDSQYMIRNRVHAAITAERIIVSFDFFLFIAPTMKERDRGGERGFSQEDTKQKYIC
jgi:hypothetical protein